MPMTAIRPSIALCEIVFSSACAQCYPRCYESPGVAASTTCPSCFGFFTIPRQGTTNKRCRFQFSSADDHAGSFSGCADQTMEIPAGRLAVGEWRASVGATWI